MASSRARTWTLWAFLASFLVILIAFRAVLFPFLMATFLAYLVEPAVDWMNRRPRLGLRWGRGVTLILMYVVAIGGLVLLVSCGVSRLTASAGRAAHDLKRELDKTAPAARFALDQPAPEDVWIPEGVQVSLEGRGAYRTWFPEQISAGTVEARVLLREVPGEASPPPPADGHRNLRPAWSKDQALRIDEASRIEVPAGWSLSAATDGTAKGLEVFSERWIIAPVSAAVERVTGSHFDPGFVRDFIAHESEARGPDLGTQVIEGARGVVFAVIGSTYRLVLVLMLTAFLVVDRKRIARFFASLPPADVRPAYEKLVGYVDRGLAGVIRGQLAICLVNGVLTWLGLWVLGVPYSTLLGFVAGVFSLIPVFGTIASSVPIVLVALATGGAGDGLLALGWIVLIHLLEANVLNPLIMGTSAELHPLVIIFALLAGKHAFGVWGALLAVPAASILISAFKYYRHEVQGVPVEEPSGHGAWLRSLLGRRKGRQAPAAPGGGP